VPPAFRLPGEETSPATRQKTRAASAATVMIHMIETERHNGHVDLIREAIAGSVGE
jgi:Protein of unknown function (DUF664)